MTPLEEKITKELDEDGIVVACRFPFPNTSPVRMVDAGIDSVWMYDRKSMTQKRPKSDS